MLVKLDDMKAAPIVCLCGADFENGNTFLNFENENQKTPDSRIYAKRGMGAKEF